MEAFDPAYSDFDELYPQIALYPHFWHDDRIHKSAQIYLNRSSF